MKSPKLRSDGGGVRPVSPCNGTNWGQSYCSWVGPGTLFWAALLTSMLWYFYWVVMEPVETDISGIVNWYVFVKMQLWEVHDVYGGLRCFGKWSPLLVIITYGLGRLIQSPLICSLQKAVHAAVILCNVALFVYLLIAGQKIISLFMVVLPLQLVFLIRHCWWVILLLPTLSAFLYYAYWLWSTSDAASKKRGANCARWFGVSLNGAVSGFILALGLHALAVLGVRWIVHRGCLPCDSVQLPKKPSLAAHRGCDFIAPENTLAAFRKAAELPHVDTFETDVQISFDGVPFVLHDPYLLRTTDVLSRCPSADPFKNATWFNFSYGECPMRDLNVGTWFVQENDVGSKDYEVFSEQKMPTFAQFLEVAKTTGKNVIFDVREPPSTHPHISNYINKSLETVLQSGIDLKKVWWLTKEGRQWVHSKYPDMVQVTKTEETSFEEFREEHIGIVNDDWTTPLSTIRKYQAANLSLSMFFVDSPFMLNYAWCIGVNSVTTNNCKVFSDLQHNHLYQVCSELQETGNQTLIPLTVTLVLCSLSCMTCLECLRKQVFKS